MLLALTRPVPHSISRCEVTHIARTPIDYGRATIQHEEYEHVLSALGCTVEQLPEEPDQPDSVFIEDTAIVVDECAVITRPGAPSRRGEIAGVADALSPYRRLFHIEAPGTLDGGDVLRVGRRFYVGLSTRSNADGARQLADALSAAGYVVETAAVRDCLHLKTAVSALPDERLLLDPRCVDATAFHGAEWIAVDRAEAAVGANVLVVDHTVVVPTAAPRTADLLRREGYDVETVDASELAKAEGGLTCCSLLLHV
jgi:dimethylargininase